jgi:hypothetical protein
MKRQSFCPAVDRRKESHDPHQAFHASQAFQVLPQAFDHFIDFHFYRIYKLLVFPVGCQDAAAGYVLRILRLIGIPAAITSCASSETGERSCGRGQYMSCRA